MVSRSPHLAPHGTRVAGDGPRCPMAEVVGGQAWPTLWLWAVATKSSGAVRLTTSYLAQLLGPPLPRRREGLVQLLPQDSWSTFVRDRKRLPGSLFLCHKGSLRTAL